MSKQVENSDDDSSWEIGEVRWGRINPIDHNEGGGKFDCSNCNDVNFTVTHNLNIKE